MSICTSNLQQQYRVVLIWLGLLGSDLVYGDGQAGPCMVSVHGILAGPAGPCMVHGMCMGGGGDVG